MFAAVLLAGCAEAPRKFAPVTPLPAGQGVIYLYRPLEPGADALVGTVLNQYRPVARIRNGGYFPYTGRPGPVYFELLTEDSSRTLLSKALIRIQPGQEKYLKITRVGDRLKFSAVFPEVAKTEIRACDLMEPAAASPTPSASATAPAPAAAYARPVARRPLSRTAVPAPVRVQGRFSFEAERLAMENGCTTPDGVRPVAYLVSHEETQDVYDVVCGSTHMGVGCQFQYCELLP